MTTRQKDILIIAILLMCTALVRLWTTMMIHTGIDERDYWYSAKAISQGFDYIHLNHRTIRWSVIIPVAAVQALCGVHPNVYYILPFINALLQTSLLYLLGKRLFSRKVAVLAVFFLIFFPYQIKAASQIRPEIFTTTYLLAIMWCISGFSQALTTKKQLHYLLYASACMYIAYHAKITNLFLMPGFLAVILWYSHKRSQSSIKNMAVFALPCLVAFMVETAIYALKTPYPFGQLHIIMSNHVSNMESLSSFWDLFSRYSSQYLQAYWQGPFLLFVIGCIDSLINKRHPNMPQLIFPAFSFFFFITFAISGISPIKAAEPFINRYLTAALPFTFLLLAWYFFFLLDKIILPGKHPATLTTQRLLLIGCIGTLCFITLPFVVKNSKAYIRSPWNKEHPFNLNTVYYTTLNSYWNKGMPILAASGMGGKDALEAISWIYLKHWSLTARTPPVVSQVSDHTEAPPYSSIEGKRPTNQQRVIFAASSPSTKRY